MADKTHKNTATDKQTQSNLSQNQTKPKTYTGIIIGTLIVVLLGGYFLYNRYFVVATVNGQSISRLSLIRELEKQGGQQALDGIITKILIMQAADKEKTTASAEEISTKVTEIEERVSQQGQELSSLLTMQGMTMDDLRDQLKYEVLVDKLANQETTISDDDIASFIEENPFIFDEDQTDTEKADIAREQLNQQQNDTAIQTWLESLRQSAVITYNL